MPPHDCDLVAPGDKLYSSATSNDKKNLMLVAGYANSFLSLNLAIKINTPYGSFTPLCFLVFFWRLQSKITQIQTVKIFRQARAQSLFLALGALVRPGVNFSAHCRNFRCRVKNFRRTASNTWSTYPQKLVMLQKERLRLCVAIWAYSSSIEHNENKYKNLNISHKR